MASSFLDRARISSVEKLEMLILCIFLNFIIFGYILGLGNCKLNVTM